MEYSLWDVESNKYLGRYEDETEALVLVRTLVSHYGPEYADDLELGGKTADGEILDSLSGAALIARADTVLSSHLSDDERRGIVIASPVSARSTVMSIEPMAVAASRVMRRASDVRNRWRQRG